MTPFIPKGDVAEWRLLYDEIKTLGTNDVLTNERIEELLNRELGSNRSPVYRAIGELERNDHKTLATVRGVGYRIAEPREHLGLSLSHSTRARRALKRGVERAESADRAQLNPDDATRLESYEAHASRVVMFLSRMARAIDDNAREIAEVRHETGDTSARVSALEDTLKRHGLS